MIRGRKFSKEELTQFQRPPAEVPMASVAPNQMVRILFSRMREIPMSYEQLEENSGVSFWTVRKWRTGVEPSQTALIAALAAVGYEIRMTAVPIQGWTGRAPRRPQKPE